MIRIFTGDDRVRAQKEIVKILGDGYEVIEGAEILAEDLASVFLGASLFAEERKILIRDLSANKAAFEKLPLYLGTAHEVVILETKLDKRSATYKELKGKVEIREFDLPKNKNFNVVFDIYRVAKKDGARALAMLDQVQQEEDPIMFAGLLVTQALKDYKMRQGASEKRVLAELSKLDLDLKSTTLQPWLLIRAFLLRLGQLS